MPRFAANLTMMFNEAVFLDRFEAAAKAGFDAVEFLFPYEHPVEVIAERLATHDLALAIFNFPPGDWSAGERGFAALPDRRKEFLAALDLGLAYGRALNVPQMHLLSGLASRDDPSALSAYRDALRLAADKAGEAGIGLLIEPLNPRDMPGYFLNDFHFAADLIRELDHPNIRLQFDIYHRQILHGGTAAALEALMPITGHVQVASAPHRNEPGSGDLDDFEVFRLLDRLGYTGFVGCEYRPAAGTLEGLGWLRKFRESSG